MSLLVDTSVWSLALRRNAPSDSPEVAALRDALGGSELVATTGVVVQELLQGVLPEGSRARIVQTFGALQYLTPSRDDHIVAAGIRNSVRAAGVQLGTIDALIAQLAMAGNHTLLTTDQDFHHAARHIDLRVWSA